ncbi:hypothetical protein ACUOA8_35640, partial [Escherichia sp. SS-MK2]
AKLGAQKKNKRNTTIQKDLSLDRTFYMPTVDGRAKEQKSPKSKCFLYRLDLPSIRAKPLAFRPPI